MLGGDPYSLYYNKKMDVKIENMIYKITFNQEMDLVKFTENVKSPRIEYNPKSFSGVIYRVGEPRVSMLIFKSGKVMCAGAKCRDDVDKALCKLLNKFEEAGITIMTYPTIEVQNIVASGGLGGTIDLEKIAYSLERAMYEPEQFPGLIYRMQDPKVVVLLFTTGNLVVTGAKKEEEVHVAVTILQKTLEEKDLIHYDQR